jgi:hypothetical protein
MTGFAMGAVFLPKRMGDKNTGEMRTETGIRETGSKVTGFTIGAIFCPISVFFILSPNLGLGLVAR